MQMIRPDPDPDADPDPDPDEVHTTLTTNSVNLKIQENFPKERKKWLKGWMRTLQVKADQWRFDQRL